MANEVNLGNQAQAILTLRARERQKKIKGMDVVDYIQQEFYIPETRGPMPLMPHHKAVLWEAHRKDAAGKFIYDVVLWSDIKKSAKSTIAAAVGTHRAVTRDFASVKVVANDLEQADSRVNTFITRNLFLNPNMKKGIDHKIVGSKYRTIFLATQSIIQAIPIDPGGEAGGNDDLIIFSELWAAKNKAMIDMWTEMTISPTKYGYSQRWIETYAGKDGDSPILEQQYARGMEGERIDLSYQDDIPHTGPDGINDGGYHDLSDLEVYANGKILMLWNTKPRCPWQTAAYYASEYATLMPHEFNRIHRNQWSGSSNPFVPPEWWDACLDRKIPALKEDDPCILIADAAVSNDSFGLLMLSGRESDDHMVDVRYAREWTPPKNGKISFEGTEDMPGPHREIRRLIEEHNVVEFVYDPYQLENFTQSLREEMVVHIYAFDQNMERLLADKKCQDKIRDKTIRYFDKPALTQHIQNADADENKEQHRLRMVKRTLKKKIDLGVCLSMGTHRAVYLRI